MPPTDAPTPAALSALCSQLDEIIRRVTDGAAATDRPGSESASAALYDAERALHRARRLLERAAGELP